MLNKAMQKLGEERSEIRELHEYAVLRKGILGEEGVFDFTLGNPSVPAPECVQAEIKCLVDGTPAELLHGYTSAAGAQDVRAAVANHIRKQFGVPMSADRVYMTSGASASLAIVLSAVLNAGDEVVVLAPYFPEYRVFVENAGGKLVVAPTNADFHPDLAALEQKIGKKTRAVIVNSPNNPTGAVYTEGEMRLIGELLKKKSAERGKPILLIADEPYRELAYTATPVYPMSVYADTVVCYSFSKVLSLAGERIGYLAVSPQCKNDGELFAAVCGAGRALGYVCAPALFQRVCARCLGQSCDVEVYRKNRDLLYSALTGFGYECAPPEGAFYLFVKSPEPDARQFCERAKKYELLLVPSDSFGTQGYVRISYCVAKSTIENSLPAFKKLIEEYQ